jgi:hypothetical protein
MENISDLDFMDTSNLKVVFILYVGKNSDGLNIYHFLLSENCDDTFAEGWAEKPSCNEKIENLMIEDSMFEYVKELRTEIKLDLAQNCCCTSMQDCRDGIIPLAYENLDEAEEYPEEGRIVIHFGDFVDDVAKKLARRDIVLNYI